MNTRLTLAAALLPSALGIAGLAAVVLPRDGHELTWPRLVAGLAVLVAFQVGGGYVAGLVLARRRSARH